MSETTGRYAIRAELVGPLVLLLLLLPLLAFAEFGLDASIVGAQAHQREIRTAQMLRARVLRFQLDEQTGVRGFELTGDRHFLEPFTKARGPFGASISALEASAKRLDLGDVVALTERQRTLNALWLATIADTATARQPTKLTHRLETRGKRLIDTFRNRDQSISEILSRSADEADARSQRSIERVTRYLVALSTAIVIAASLFGFFRAASARQRFESELVLANQRRIAESLRTAFTNNGLPTLAGVSLRGTYVCAEKETQVGGDWYDAFQLPDGRILFSIGDVAGHGIEAAVVMSHARQAIIAAAIGESDPAMVLERANRTLLLQHAKMVTAICGFVDAATFEVVYSTAGHPAPILVRPDVDARYLPQSGVPLGVFTECDFQTYVITPEEGSVIFLYTDGLLEHGRDIVAGEGEILAASLKAICNIEDPARELHRLILAELPTFDDVAILSIGFAQHAIAVGDATDTTARWNSRANQQAM